ncbi:TPA: hypothetical protein GF715_18320 [Citrobacter rodentium NBRC 105723 = DSM 16636]|nr:hypothetical protein [Citrobacter rodentium NBRC 105723 = DSM 16636]HAT8019518.1 hypothetical protein [Citrobacter rodentium]HAT8029152.1 hypothetical protein [Citrobacter rodentium]HAT8034256.1 hypothetical protein [Citrobacter rodentium]HAT8039077.1 hypothetical protein [Citrobacter rodentium]
MYSDGNSAFARQDAGILCLKDDDVETYRLTCCDLRQSSGKKQNIPSKRNCHPFSVLKRRSGRPGSHIITISLQLAAKYWSYQGR